MKKYKTSVPVHFMAQHLNVSVSGFYDWLRNRLSGRAIQFKQNSIFVKLAHQENQESYGHVHLTKHLQAQGIEISQCTVHKIKKIKNLYCKRHKRFKRTTNSNHQRPAYHNLLN